MGRVSEKITTFLPWPEIEPEAQKQILNTAELPFIFKWVAVMPDCHYGKGATVGTVIATKGAVVPAAVGGQWPSCSFRRRKRVGNVLQLPIKDHIPKFF